MKASQAGQAEVAMGQLGQQKASSDAVKQLAKTMMDDHQKANSQLQQIAGQEGLQISNAPDPRHDAMAQKMQAMSGNDFDRMFASSDRTIRRQLRNFKKKPHRDKIRN